jgi:hypothetical protein
MRKLSISAPLKEEFATVEAIWNSSASTRRVDALLLSWIKYEKQLRRLFCFIVFQHPKIYEDKLDKFIDALAEKDYIYTRHYMKGIKALSGTSVRDILAPRWKELNTEIERIRKYRHKFIHGQKVAARVTSPQVERDVLWIVDWINCLADGAEKQLGYDGLKRGTYRIAKSSPKISIEPYPFNTVEEFNMWLDTDIAPPRKK